VVGNAVLVIHVDLGHNYDWLWLAHWSVNWLVDWGFNDFGDCDGNMFNLSLFNFGDGVGLDCGLELIACFRKMLVGSLNLLLLSLNLAGILLFKINTDLVVDERNDHSIVERDQVRRFVFDHLVV
jgi:hypothetical protein